MELIHCKTIIVQCILYLILIQTEAKSIVVKTTHGPVRGSIATSRKDLKFYSFKGIPYAKPPLGKLRFKAPEEPDKWEDVLNTITDPPYCAQKNYLFANPKVEGSEDCLYLNVHTPQIKQGDYFVTQPLPVMVFIHWGGFFAGYGTSDYLGPDYFMDEPVILVTFNYRLGVLGFLSTSDDVAPGNFGLKDQVAALKWVRNNIENFGGDKNKVTIFGQSAGAASVHYHMLSPSSKGLFQQAISQSGSALALWAKPLQLESLIFAKHQALFLDCDPTNSTVIVDCLRSKSVEDLLNSGDKFKYFSVDPLNVFMPSIEKETLNNQYPFITKDPVEYIRNRESNNVPWIIGIVENEGLLRAEPIIRQQFTRHNLNSDFNNIMPNILGLALSTPKASIPNVWQKIKDFYFLAQNYISVNNTDTLYALINVYTDRSFAYSSYQTALFHNLMGHNSIWFYNFKYRGEYSYGNVFAATNETIPFKWGVSHCDELLYLFRSSALFPELTKEEDVKVSEFLIKTWARFARIGDPSPQYLKWRKLDNNKEKHLHKKINYLNIDGYYKLKSSLTVSMKYGIYKQRFHFWENIPLVENIPELNQTHIDL